MRRGFLHGSLAGLLLAVATCVTVAVVDQVRVAREWA